MARTDVPWEQRRYWHEGLVVRVEWWRGVRVSVRVPPLQHLGQIGDYCYDHGTRIYPDLGCQICRQRPGPSQP